MFARLGVVQVELLGVHFAVIVQSVKFPVSGRFDIFKSELENAEASSTSSA